MTSIYNIDNNNCFIPSGSVLAYIGSTINDNYAIRYTFGTDTVSSTTIKEDVTNSYNATLVNGATIASDSGSRVSGQGYLKLNSASSQYVTIPAFTTGTSGLTFSFWFRSSSTGTWGRVFDFGNGAPSNNIIVSVNDNNLTFSLPGYNKYTTISVNDNVWRHVVWILTNSDWKIYVNGILHTTYTTDIAYPPNISRTINYLGRSNWTADPYFNGGISEFRFYNRAVSAIEVSYIYYNTTDPPGWVIADGAERTTSSIYNNLVNLSIGSRNGSNNYVPPNLKGAFLRGTGTNGNYVGSSTLLSQQSHAIQEHKHIVSQAAHTHGTNPASTGGQANKDYPSYGLVKCAGPGHYPSYYVTEDEASNNDDYDMNVKAYAGFVIKNATLPTITVDENTNTNSNNIETRPFSYGVVWIIKL